MNKPTVVIVNDFAWINGGASQVALASAVEMARREMTVYLFASVGPIDESLKQAGVSVTLIDQHEILSDPNRLRAARQGIWNSRAHNEFGRLLETLDPLNTIIHVHTWVKALSPSVIKIAVESGFPLLTTLHDYFTVCPNGGLYDYTSQRVCTKTPMSLPCLLTNCDKRSFVHKVWRSVRQTVQMHVGNIPHGMSQFVTVSEFSERLLRPLLPSGAVLHHVANPITASKRERAMPAEHNNFLFVGRLDPEKGVLLLAEAAAQIGAIVRFVGDGPMRNEVPKVLPGTEFTGWLKPHELMKQFRTARALVFPSLWYETQGLTVLEAAACGLPAIVPDECAASDAVDHGVTGLVFKRGDANDLADKMSAMSDPRAADRMGKCAFERYWSRPSTVDLHVDRLCRVYSDLVTQNANRNGREYIAEEQFAQ